MNKTRRPNPKKDKEAQRKRNTLYWFTGGRQMIKFIDCPDCLKLSRSVQQYVKCVDCKNDLLSKKKRTTEDKSAK